MAASSAAKVPSSTFTNFGAVFHPALKSEPKSSTQDSTSEYPPLKSRQHSSFRKLKVCSLTVVDHFLISPWTNPLNFPIAVSSSSSKPPFFFLRSSQWSKDSPALSPRSPARLSSGCCPPCSPCGSR